MAEQVKGLSEKDIVDLAAYFASQRALAVKY
jgi:cytochrome c553